MTDPADYELLKRHDEGGDERQGGPGRVWAVLAAVLVAGAIIGAYLFFRGGDEEAAPATAATPAAEEPAESAGPLGGEPMPGDVPPLDESDPFVRELIRHLSEHPQVAAWLATDNLVRNFTVSVTNIANGRTPSPHLAVLRPKGQFQVEGAPEDLRIDPRSYERYNQLAEAVDSVSASGTAEIYATLKPRIEEAHRELGGQGSFDQTLERAILTLLRTPLPEEPVRVQPTGIGYGFADPKLEQLTGAQKQLVRMGPRNARIVKDKLREIALELGIPESRLPAG